MPELTAKQQKFVEGVLQGLTHADAYRRAGYRAEGKSPQTIAKMAYRVSKTPAVQKQIQKGQSELAKKEIWRREDALSNIVTVISGAMRNCIKKTEGEEVFLPQVATVAIRAIEQANKMCGFHEAQRLEMDAKVEFLMGELDEYAD